MRHGQRGRVTAGIGTVHRFLFLFFVERGPWTDFTTVRTQASRPQAALEFSSRLDLWNSSNSFVVPLTDPRGRTVKV